MLESLPGYAYTNSKRNRQQPLLTSTIELTSSSAIAAILNWFDDAWPAVHYSLPRVCVCTVWRSQRHDDLLVTCNVEARLPTFALCNSAWIARFTDDSFCLKVQRKFPGHKTRNVSRGERRRRNWYRRRGLVWTRLSVARARRDGPTKYSGKTKIVSENRVSEWPTIHYRQHNMKTCYRNIVLALLLPPVPTQHVRARALKNPSVVAADGDAANIVRCPTRQTCSHPDHVRHGGFPSLPQQGITAAI